MSRIALECLHSHRQPCHWSAYAVLVVLYPRDSCAFPDPDALVSFHDRRRQNSVSDQFSLQNRPQTRSRYTYLPDTKCAGQIRAVGFGRVAAVVVVDDAASYICVFSKT